MIQRHLRRLLLRHLRRLLLVIIQRHPRRRFPPIIPHHLRPWCAPPPLLCTLLQFRSPNTVHLLRRRTKRRTRSRTDRPTWHPPRCQYLLQPVRTMSECSRSTRGAPNMDTLATSSSATSRLLPPKSWPLTTAPLAPTPTTTSISSSKVPTLLDSVFPLATNTRCVPILSCIPSPTPRTHPWRRWS